MNGTSNRFQVAVLLLASVGGNACAVERSAPPVQERMAQAQIVVVVDGIEPLPKAQGEFDKFFRVNARIAGVLKGEVAIGERIEIVVDNTISELRNECCSPDHAYVVFLREKDGKYYFVGSPLGSIPLDLQKGK